MTKWGELKCASGEQVWNNRGEKSYETESKRGVNDLNCVGGPWLSLKAEAGPKLLPHL